MVQPLVTLPYFASMPCMLIPVTGEQQFIVPENAGAECAVERRGAQQESQAAGIAGVQEQLRVLLPAPAEPAGMHPFF